MIKKLYRSLAFLCLLLMCALVAQAQAPGSNRGVASGDGNNMIQGRVHFPSGQAASGKTIKVQLEIAITQTIAKHEVKDGKEAGTE